MPTLEKDISGINRDLTSISAKVSCFFPVEPVESHALLGDSVEMWTQLQCAGTFSRQCSSHGSSLPSSSLPVITWLQSSLHCDPEAELELDTP